MILKTNRTILFAVLVTAVSLLSSCTLLGFGGGGMDMDLSLWCADDRCKKSDTPTVAYVKNHDGTRTYYKVDNDGFVGFDSGQNPDGTARTVSQFFAARIPWHPESLDSQNCPDISGTYSGTHKDPNGKVSNDKILMQQSEKELVMSLPGGAILVKGKLQHKETFRLDSSMAGCVDGDVVIREVNMDGAGSKMTATAVETRFRKLNGGNLQIMRHERQWYCEALLGLPGNPKEKRVSRTLRLDTP